MARFKVGDKIVFTVQEVTEKWYRFWEDDDGWVIDLKTADKFGESLATYQNDAWAAGYDAKAWVQEKKKPIKEADNVNHPFHYCGKIETIDFIEDKLGMGFIPYCLGNVIKYISRYDKKGRPEEDLKKAAVYLDWAIRKLGEGDEDNH